MSQNKFGKKLDNQLCPDTCTQLSTTGKFSASLRKGRIVVGGEVHVVKGLHKPLLGRPAIDKLRLVSVSDIATIDRTDNLTPAEKFPQLFKGLGKLQGYYQIRLQDGMKPYALSTPRRVAIPLLRSVKLELQRMEDMGVIAKVREPSEWCAGMVVVPKPNGKVVICVS